MIKTLRRKFICIAMGSIILVLLIIIGSINISNYMNIDEAVSRRIQRIADNGGKFPDAEHFHAKKNKHEGAEAPYDTRYFTVALTTDGIVSTINTGRISAISSRDAAKYASTLFAKNSTHGIVDNYCYKQFKQTNSSGKITLLYVFVDCERELRACKSFAIVSAGISLVGLIIVFLLVVFFSRLATKPMVESYEKQKRFITDASHELKTPLTIIDANTEILELTSGENEWTQSTRKQVQRLTSLTEKLVLLSRMDEENNQIEMLDFNLSDAIMDTISPYNSVAKATDKTLSIQITPDISYHGNEKSIRQLISLLMDNAIKYSSPNGSIEISLSTTGKNKIFSITNSVDEIHPGRHDELFERFYRTDSSHNSQTGGFGIGLSVASAIVQSHKGKISAYSADGCSLQFTVTL